jgi:hypothetical protein
MAWGHPSAIVKIYFSLHYFFTSHSQYMAGVCRSRTLEMVYSGVNVSNLIENVHLLELHKTACIDRTK